MKVKLLTAMEMRIGMTLSCLPASSVTENFNEVSALLTVANSFCLGPGVKSHVLLFQQFPSLLVV